MRVKPDKPIKTDSTNAKQPNSYLSYVPVWSISNWHVLALLAAAFIPAAVLSPLGEIAGIAVSRLFPGWTLAHIAGAVIANFSAFYLALVGWRHVRVKLFAAELTRTLSSPDLVVTEALFNRLTKELRDVLPYYVPTITSIAFDTQHLPRVMEGEQFQVTAPCIASLTFGLLPHHEGYQDVVLRPGLLLTAGKIHSDTAFAFQCVPENMEQFISDNLPGHFEKSSRFSGSVSIGIFRYHIGNELIRLTEAG